jgi:hypothetical protein
MKINIMLSKAACPSLSRFLGKNSGKSRFFLSGKKKILLLILFLLIGVQAYSQPQPPTLISPCGSSVCAGNVLLDWTDVTGATSYRVQVFQGATLILDVSGIPVSQYLIPSIILQNNTTYYWRANATGPGGTSGWSSQCSFATLGIPNPPALIAPPNNAVGISTNPTFDWGYVFGATYYIFQLSKFPLFDSLIINDTTPLPPITLQSNTQYFWRMMSGNTCGTGNWSPVNNFTTGMAPPAPPILICDTSNVPLTPTLDWNDVPNAITYRIQISTTPIFSSTIVNAIVTISQYTVPSGILNYSSHFYWRVNAMNTYGTSPWSSVCSFTTIGSSSIRIISSEVPAEYKLYSNYPNPFNPTTKIKFDIQKSVVSSQYSVVTLKVFDILGKENATLVNEKLNPGTYEVTFDGSNYSSGIYFYRLITDGFSETKRMTLIK